MSWAKTGYPNTEIWKTGGVGGVSEMEEDQRASPGLRMGLRLHWPALGQELWGGWGRIWMGPSLDLMRLRAQQGSWSSISPTEPRSLAGQPGLHLSHHRPSHCCPPPPSLSLWQDHLRASAASSVKGTGYPLAEKMQRALEKRCAGTQGARSLYLFAGMSPARSPEPNFHA